jgi:hypothetical protein
MVLVTNGEVFNGKSPPLKKVLPLNNWFWLFKDNTFLFSFLKDESLVF